MQRSSFNVGDLVKIKCGASRLTHKRFVGQIGIICGIDKRFLDVQIIGIKVKFKNDEILLVKKCP